MLKHILNGAKGRSIDLNINSNLKHYDLNRVDNLVTCGAWKQMKNIAAEEGLIAIPYENKYAQYRYF